MKKITLASTLIVSLAGASYIQSQSGNSWPLESLIRPTLYMLTRPRVVIPTFLFTAGIITGYRLGYSRALYEASDRLTFKRPPVSRFVDWCMSWFYSINRIQAIRPHPVEPHLKPLFSRQQPCPQPPGEEHSTIPTAPPVSPRATNPFNFL